MEEAVKILFANLNGFTESALLFILIFYDTLLGGRWRKKHKVARTSEGGLGGLRKSVPLAFMPLAIWLITILMSVLPTHVGGRDVIYSPLVFDIISFFMTLTIGSYLMKSILANMQLSGMTIPKFFIKWVEDELHVKFEKIKEEPSSAEKDYKNGK